MDFRELLVNLLGARSKWRVSFKVPEGKGNLIVQRGVVVFAELESGGENYEGEEALERIMELSSQVEDVELLSVSGEVNKNLNVDQLELISMMGLVDFSEEVKEERETSTCSFKIEEVLKLFPKGSVKLLAFEGDVELLTLSSSREELRKEVLELGKLKEFVDADYLLINFKEFLGVLVFGNGKTLFLLLDDRGRGDFELEEPDIVEKIKTLLNAS